MQPSNPIRHNKSSLTQEMRMMANNHGPRRPQPQPQRFPNSKPNMNSRPRGFPMHNTFTNHSMIPPNQSRGMQSMGNPLQRSMHQRNFQKNQYSNSQINRNNPQSMATIRSPNQLGASKSFAQGLYGRNNPSINHSNVISVSP